MRTHFPSRAFVVFSVAICLPLVGFRLFQAFATQQASIATIGQVDTASGKDSAAKQANATKSEINLWEPSSKSKPAWLQPNEHDELSSKIEQSIRERLRQRRDFLFNAVPLSNVMKFFANELDVTFLIDDKALEDESISPDEPITLKLVNSRGDLALGFILEPLQLCYTLKNEVVVITSKNVNAEVIRYYDLSHVLPDNSMCYEIIHLIESLVAPDTWQIAGGNSSIAIFGSMLVVRTTEDVHTTIEDVLRKLATQSSKNMKPSLVLPKTMMGTHGCACGTCGNVHAPGNAGGMGGMM
jgi:hypothetical protein